MKGWTSCKPKQEDYWKWDGSHAIVLLTFTSIGFLLLLFNLIIFLVFRKKAVMKQAGGNMYLFIIAGLALSFSSVILFIGKPSVAICIGRQLLYALGFSLIVLCILVKALRTYVVFNLLFQSKEWFHKRGRAVIIIGGTLIQVLICTLWMIFDSPDVDTSKSDQSMIITFQCKEGSGTGFALMLSYIALLALICFSLAFKVRKVPHRFNETGHIILSMLIYLFVWVCFTPVYIAKINERYSIQAAAILVSCYGIIFCHFAPKWYMALCKKKEEISEQAYMAKAIRDRTLCDSIHFTPETPHRPYYTIHGSQNTIDSDDTGLGSIVYAINLQNKTGSNQTIRQRRKSV